MDHALPLTSHKHAHITTALSRLFAPVSVMPLIYFRLAFGAIMLWEVWRYAAYGWIARYYIEPTFFFSYFGFDWVKPLPGMGMYWIFLLLAILAALILCGLFYRISAVLFFVCFTYVFLLDQTRYLNHFYLISLISFILIFLPAADRFSLDALRRPSLRRSTAPLWTLYLLRFQIGVVYFFGGVAKLNGDWLQGEPMRMWLAGKTDFPFIGQWFTEEWMVYLFSYGGLLFDLLFVPLVLWRRTRWPALLIALLFHLANARLFSIGIFPWFMIAANLLFLPPQWFAALGERIFMRRTVGMSAAQNRDSSARRRIVLAALGLYVGIQIFMPLRHFLYPGDVSWTEQGHKFSWHMKLRDKDAQIRFYVTDTRTGAVWEVDTLTYLTSRQLDEIAGDPEMILQFSHYLARIFREQGFGEVEVRAWTHVSLNGRRSQTLIDPTVNLAAQPRSLFAASWIMPLTQPLKDD